MTKTLLEVKNLSKIFTRRGGIFGRKVENVAVGNVSFSLGAGETLGIVGESGSGKSTLALLIMRLSQANGGQIFFGGQNITDLNEKKLKPFRRRMQMIFQDPFAALDPFLKVGQILCEPLEIYQIGTKKERIFEAASWLERVGLAAEDLNRYPSEFSGGQQQRIGIARALILRPDLLICDEAVSALDVSVQAQILNLLRDLQDEFNLSYIFISHNIAVTAFMSQKIGVMYRGKLIEIGTTEQIIKNPQQDYTKSLIAAIPEIALTANEEISGEYQTV